MTVDEFLPWAEAQESGRYELFDGEIVMQQAERNAHLETKAAIWLALREGIGRAGLKCRAVPDGATVRISDRTAFEPDALVYCGERLAPDALEFPNPIIVVEVLSPGNSLRDLRDKLQGYFLAPSVQHYLIADPEKRLVIHHARGEGDMLHTRIVTQGALRLIPPGLEISVETLFT
jgi:Uma2 family endonuclease